MQLNPFRLLFIFLAILITLKISCSKELESTILKENHNLFKVWALADIQPVSSDHKKAFSKAVKDINSISNDIEMAIVAGDIVNRTEEKVFDWYIDERNKSYIDDWNEIIGNHDLKTDMGALFKAKVKEKVHYTKFKGNILFIFLSDEARGKSTTIKEETFIWWKDLVVSNQDKIIIVTTHAPLEGSSIPFSSRDGRKIISSERFVEVLKNYKVDLWLSGHLHLPHAFTNTLVKKEDLNGTIFTHISSIRPELLGLKNSESRLLEFNCGTNKLKIKSRNHSNEKWDNSLEQTHILSKKIICD